MIARKHPDWIRVRAPVGTAVTDTRAIVQSLRLHTVCEEAQCPNLGECWAHHTATFMLLGDTCTRNCRFCAVTHGRPGTVDADEPRRVAEAVARLGLEHVVVTSVNRDDLADGGAGHFAETARQVRARVPDCTVEVLMPDFQGDGEALAMVVRAPIRVLNHNTETVPRLYKRARPGASYERSLGATRRRQTPATGAQNQNRIDARSRRGARRGARGTRATSAPPAVTSSRSGSTSNRAPSSSPSTRFLHPDEFAELGAEARLLGFSHVESGPLVRSSYHAWRQHLD